MKKQVKQFVANSMISFQMVSELESKKKTNRAAKQIRKSRQIHEISYDKSIKKTTPFIILRQ